MRACVQLEQVETTGGFLSARDYTIKVENLPTNCSEEELRLHFQSLVLKDAQAAREAEVEAELARRRPCCGLCGNEDDEEIEMPPVPPDEGRIAEVYLAEDCEELFETCMLRGTLLKRLEEAWIAVDNRIRDLEKEHGASPGALPRLVARQDARLQDLLRFRDNLQRKVREVTDKANHLHPVGGVLAAFITFERAEDAARVLRAYGNGDYARWCCLPTDLRMRRLRH